MIYLDNAATTPTDHRVVEAMLPYMNEKFLNPSAIYADEISDIVEQARATIASFVGCDPDGVIFTSGGTESDNLAVAGIAETCDHPRILTSSIEHKAILETCKWLHRSGKADVTIIDPDEEGFVEYMDVIRQINHSHFDLVSIMTVNNEVGTSQPIWMIGQHCAKRGVLFHTDAVQAIHAERINMSSYGINMLSMSAHKFNGPKGIGALCCDRDALSRLSPILHGGLQQRGLRPGTENVPGIVGMAKAIELLRDEWYERFDLVKQADTLMRQQLSTIQDMRFNGRGPSDGGTYGYVSVSFKDVDAESLLLALRNEGVYASAGSACNTDSIEVSHVLQAIKVPEEYIKGTIRFTLSYDTNILDVLEACSIIKRLVSVMRSGKEIV